MDIAYRQILVHLDAAERSMARFSIARRLAQEHGASLAALYGALPSFVELPYAPELGPSVAASLPALDDERCATARKRFDRALESPGPVASWAEAREPGLIAAVTEQAFHADLLVLGQHDPAEGQFSDVPPDLVEALLLESGKPALVVPYAGSFDGGISTAVVAWKPTREAARAVSAAMPLLRRAGRVVVLQWSAEPSVVQGERLDLAGFLRLHGVQAEFRSEGDESPRLGEYLLSRAADFSADLLVMGCYGHSRAREWVLGGTSRTMLASMTLPVLMAH
jgi:nucleotide-binding universal stress UspA family protein